MTMRDFDPCDECGQRPTYHRGLCLVCIHLTMSDVGDEREPTDDEATDEEIAEVERAWENWRIREPR